MSQFSQIHSLRGWGQALKVVHDVEVRPKNSKVIVRSFGIEEGIIGAEVEWAVLAFAEKNDLWVEREVVGRRLRVFPVVQVDDSGVATNDIGLSCPKSERRDRMEPCIA